MILRVIFSHLFRLFYLEKLASTAHRLTSSKLLEESAEMLDLLEKILVLTAKIWVLFLMSTDKIKILLRVFMQIKAKKIWELVIKDLCLVMLQMNGTPLLFIHIPTFLLTNSARRWLSKERMDLSHGWDQTANHR